MPVRVFITALLCLLVSAANAERVRDLDLKLPDDYEVPQQEPGAAGSPVQPSQEFEWMNRPPADPVEDCVELMKKYDANKGRPQRRWAIRNYYETYCEQHPERSWQE